MGGGYKTSPTRVKARHHCCNLRALIGRVGGGGHRLSSLHAPRRRLEGPKKTSWMKSLHGVLHRGYSFMVLMKPSLGRPLGGGPNGNFGRPWPSYFLIFSLSSNIDFQDRFQDRQTPPSNSLRLIEFETYNYIKPNPSLFLRQQMVPHHGPFSIHTMLEDPWLHKTTFPSQHPWYGLWMRVKGPHYWLMSTQSVGGVHRTLLYGYPIGSQGRWLVGCPMALNYN